MKQGHHPEYLETVFSMPEIMLGLSSYGYATFAPASSGGWQCRKQKRVHDCPTYTSVHVG